MVRWSGRSGVCVTALTCAALLMTACGRQAPSPHASGAHQAFSPPARVAREQLADRYLAIAQAGNRRLERDLGRLEDRDRIRLITAKAALADAAATERLFDHRLSRIEFGPPIEPIATLLYRLNQARASATAAAARSATLRQLRKWLTRLDRENAAVEEAVRIVRSQLGLPPPETS
jgi:hypothetical protein